MAGDEELRLRARSLELDPGDAGLALATATAYLRSGDEARAEAVLVAALDRTPGDPVATELLDRLGGGRARGAVWASTRGDARRSGRARASGPDGGSIVGRSLVASGMPLESFAVAAPGRGVVLGRDTLLEVTENGFLTVLHELDRRSGLGEVALLPAGRLLLVGKSRALALVPRERGGYACVPHRPGHARAWAAGASGLIYAAAAAALVDFPFAVPAERRSLAWLEGEADMGLAIAPGGDLLVATEGHPKKARPAILARRDPAGRSRFELELEARHLANGHTGPIVADDGTCYLAFPGGSLHAIDVAGEHVFERPYVGEPAALAGPRGEVLVCRLPHTRRGGLAALDRATGRLLWSFEDGFYGLPKSDERGVVYVRRDDDLVALEARDGRVRACWPSVGRRHWDFVLSGEGRAWVFVRDADLYELVVLA